MPIYEYICKDCGNKFELIRFASDSDSDIECPGCGRKKTEKVVSSPVGLCGSCQSCSGGGVSPFT
ncbi:MAG: zinc ribbon domain-containing protein [Thermodesulfobacteriota bacterium]|nr:zinc ribbon domain-containing protein [Thermodesulfobacteriota bacterium]